MATPIEELFEKLTKARVVTPPTRSEITAAENGHTWLGKKGDGSSWSVKKTGTDTFEMNL